MGVQVIVRQRGGNLVYDEGEVEVMCDDLRAISDAADVLADSASGV